MSLPRGISGSGQIWAFVQEHGDTLGSGSGDSQKSVLWERLMLLIGWGLVSTNTARWLAEGAVKDGLELAPLVQLSKVGAHGAYPGNCRRDMLRALVPTMITSKPVQVEIPTQDTCLEICLMKHICFPIDFVCKGQTWRCSLDEDFGYQSTGPFGDLIHIFKNSFGIFYWGEPGAVLGQGAA